MISATTETIKALPARGGGTEEDASAVDERPHSVYELLTRQMLEQVKSDVSEVKSRVNTLLWMVAGAILLDLVMRMLK